MIKYNLQFFGGRGSAGGNSVKSEYNPENTTEPGHQKWKEVSSSLSIKTHPNDIRYMINQVDSGRTMDQLDTLFGIKRNSDGYILRGHEGIRYEEASPETKQRIIDVLKRYAKNR